LAACAAKEYFHEMPVLLILLRKINKTGISENFILPPKAAEYSRDSLFFYKHSCPGYTEKRPCKSKPGIGPGEKSLFAPTKLPLCNKSNISKGQVKVKKIVAFMILSI